MLHSLTVFRLGFRVVPCPKEAKASCRLQSLVLGFSLVARFGNEPFTLKREEVLTLIKMPCNSSHVRPSVLGQLGRYSTFPC